MESWLQGISVKWSWATFWRQVGTEQSFPDGSSGMCVRLGKKFGEVHMEKGQIVLPGKGTMK